MVCNVARIIRDGFVLNVSPFDRYGTDTSIVVCVSP